MIGLAMTYHGEPGRGIPCPQRLEMPNKHFIGAVRALRGLGAAALLLFPALLRGQYLSHQALSSFSDDTSQLAYTNLAQLRGSTIYPEIRKQLLDRKFRSFLDSLRWAGIDTEKDVDEVILGWRGSTSDAGNFFGLATGRFQPEQARQFFAQRQLPARQYQGTDLYAFSSGAESVDFLFAFLDTSLAAFGHSNDLTALLDARAGARRTLDSNSEFASWAAELEGTAPQWGVMTGKAAANFALPWLTGGAKLPVDASAALAPVRAVLYRIEWGGGLSLRLSIVCQNVQSAGALAQLLSLWRDSQRPAGATASPTALPTLSDLNVETNGARVEVAASASTDLLQSLSH